MTGRTVERLPDPTYVEEPDRPIAKHLYPKDPRYRRSGHSTPQIGDVALCGHAKRRPPVDPEVLVGLMLCERCRRLDALGS